MKTAKLIKPLEGFTGNARLYELSEPVEYNGGKTLFLVASATSAPFSGPETYLFPADSDGEVLNWGALPGSQRGTLDITQTLQDAGYTVI